MQLDTLLMGTVIFGAIALIGVLGVLVDTKKNPGVKWAVFLLLLVGAAVGIHREYQKEEAVKTEQKRAAEALVLANESSRMVENGILKQQEELMKYNEVREQLHADIQRQRAILESLVNEIVNLSGKIEEMTAAAEKVRKLDISDIGKQARFEASKKLLKLAKLEAWVTDGEFKKLAAPLKKKEPLSGGDLVKILELMAKKGSGASTAP